jgi:hypothetical protein
MIPALPHAPLWVAGILTVAAGIAIVRKIRRGPRDLAFWLQVPAAALVYLGLFPPQVSVRTDTLTVLVGANLPRSVPHDQFAVALPGAAAPAVAEAVPDLATALRTHAAVSRLAIVGDGLSARDREAVAGRELSFQQSPARGLVELQAPDTVPLGRQWALSGRAASPTSSAASGTSIAASPTSSAASSTSSLASPTSSAASRTRRVELRDPSGALVDAVDVDAAGRFALSAAARGVGAVRFELRLLGADHSVVDTVSIPLIVVGGEPLAVVVRYGDINPELKYWRRWATDAGLTVGVAAGVTDGVSIQAGDARLTAGSLANADVVMIDARGWAALDAAEKAALHAAIDQGLGLLLRADSTLTADTIADWHGWGFAVATAPTPSSVTLDRKLGLHERAPLTAAAVTVDAPTSTVQLQADDGTPLAWWRNQGRGRVALWRLEDSYRLVLMGEQERYAGLWASTLELLARPRAPAAPAPQLPHAAWVLERAVLCGLGSAAHVLPPGDAPAVALAVNSSGCAAYWPATAGWHRLETGANAWPFYVRAVTDGASWRVALDAAATQGMATAEGSSADGLTAEGSTAEARRPPESGRASAEPAMLRPMARWPWLLASLLVTAAIWWSERRAYARR